MKKFIAGFCGILLLFSFCSCGTSESTHTPSYSASPFISPTEAITVAPSAEPTPTPTGQQFYTTQRVALARTALLDGEWLVKAGYNDSAIRAMDTKRLLYYYYETAGLTEKNEGNTPYSDWESSYQLWGITLGHYLSACSMYYATTQEQWYLDKVNYCLTELALCQKDNGFLLAMAESRFDLLEAGHGDAVLYYFVHKVLAGLADAYRYCGSDKALDMATKLSMWVYNRTKDLTTAQRAYVYAVEYGGVGEALYDMYDITGKEEILEAARFFNEPALVSRWATGNRNLVGLHANTHIPKAIAMWREYLVSGDERYAKAAKNFFAIVTEDQTFANGSNSCGECFYTPQKEYEQVASKKNLLSETCNAYNMIKLGQYLYEYTGEDTYIDFVERALMNAIYGSENTKGGKTYYHYLYHNAKKVYNLRNAGFWCCTGTGLENFAKVSGQLYYEHDNTVTVALYISSSYTDGTLAFDMHCEDNRSVITVTAGGEKTIRLRVPYWARSASVTVNGSPTGETVGGYIMLTRNWASGDKIELSIPYKTYVRRVADNEDAYNLFYGPYLMACDHKTISEVLEGNFESGWLSDPDGLIALTDPEEKQYTLTVGKNTLTMKKYGDIVLETYTAYFLRR